MKKLAAGLIFFFVSSRISHKHCSNNEDRLGEEAFHGGDCLSKVVKLSDVQYDSKSWNHQRLLVLYFAVFIEPVSNSIL